MNWLTTAPVTVLLKNISWTPASGEVKAIEGGTDQDGVGGADTYVVNNALNGPSGDRMYYTVSTVGADTLISLFKSPLRTPQIGNTGLATTNRLYGMDYIPSPLEDFVSPGPPAAFSKDLVDPTATTNRPKNTARWVLSIPSSSLPTNARVTIETRIGSDLTTGVLYPSANQPGNLSRTYAWRGTDLWIFGDGTFANPPHLPLTERFQTIGDPRHMPYQDLKRVYTPTTLPLGSAFNRYFDDFHDASNNLGDTTDEWIGWQSTAGSPNGIKNLPTVVDPNDDGWDVTEAGDPGPQGMLEVDVNRIFQMFRSALLPNAFSLYNAIRVLLRLPWARK